MESMWYDCLTFLPFLYNIWNFRWTDSSYLSQYLRLNCEATLVCKLKMFSCLSWVSPSARLSVCLSGVFTKCRLVSQTLNFVCLKIKTSFNCHMICYAVISIFTSVYFLNNYSFILEVGCSKLVRFIGTFHQNLLPRKNFMEKKIQ